MATRPTNLGTTTLESIPEGQPVSIMSPSYFQPTSGKRASEGTLPGSISSVSNDSGRTKWDTLRKRVKKHSLRFVGLEQPRQERDHWDAVHRSIVVGKLAKQVSRSDAQQSIQQSLANAIIRQDSVSTGQARSLLRQVSILSDANTRTPGVSPASTLTRSTAGPTAKRRRPQESRPVHPLSKEGMEMIELDSARTEMEKSTSAPEFPSGVTSPPQSRPPLLQSASLPVPASMRIVSPPTTSYLSKPTGRIHTQEAKPDLWKIALYSIRFVQQKRESHQSQLNVKEAVERDQALRSFLPAEKTDRVPLTPPPVPSPVSSPLTPSGKEIKFDIGTLQLDGATQPDGLTGLPEQEDDTDFFGAEKKEYLDGTVSRHPSPYSMTSMAVTKMALSAAAPSGIFKMKDVGADEAEEEERRRRTLQRRTPTKKSYFWNKKQYRPNAQVLGGLTLRLLNFKYKDVPESTQHMLNEMELPWLHRPFFTYWLMLANIVILIASLSLFGFAPYGFDQFTERALVQQSNLAVEVVEKNVTPNVWGGPPQSALVLLGAKYGPCMRHDRQLFAAIEGDVLREGSESGCCVRRDQSGCVQVLSEESCPDPFADFIFTDQLINTSLYTNRAVCGTSPRTCIDPDPTRDVRWQSENITGWPVCLDSQSPSTVNFSSHLSCNLTGHPCCVGIQAHCLITTFEQCEFLDGRFHQDAFLCSQVDCVNEICGMLPFASKGQPDQVYRLWLSLFLHAGIIHLFFTLLFDFFVLRHVEKYLGWFRTAFIYIGSGLGGNIVSAVFVPYSPEVGPAGSIFGIISFFLVYIVYQAHRLDKPLIEAVKLFIVIAILLACGLFPFIDNFAHIGGFLFGIILSGIVAPYLEPNEAEIEYDKFLFSRKHPSEQYHRPRDWIKILKYTVLIVGPPLLIILYTLFFVLFYVVQDSWDGFRYVNCLPLTSTLCLDFGQSIRSRDIFVF